MSTFYQKIRRSIIKELIINEDIKAKDVRLIDDMGNQVGIVSLRDAREMANEKDLDLALMSPNAKPPVVKIMDYGKYRYDTIKKEKEDRKKQKTTQIKEIRFSVGTESHDLETKANQAIKFLENGDKVKVTVRFRGREIGRKELGKKVLDEFTDILGSSAKVEKKATMEGRNMTMYLVKNAE
ncbi:MAG: translation initiation factor IF-3 [Peptoniphilaceae bacterium]|nr:translation initiation factor IF-3 [Peptoniphilaceae bacterium]MDD7383285.1 translation initiation factor IF-3 [Peptoniphilaceae bacterium]MDY3738344.1 translation initiation factor IF-3 [Peptoniphilaceae bacterium]